MEITFKTYLREGILHEFGISVLTLAGGVGIGIGFVVSIVVFVVVVQPGQSGGAAPGGQGPRLSGIRGLEGVGLTHGWALGDVVCGWF